MVGKTVAEDKQAGDCCRCHIEANGHKDVKAYSWTVEKVIGQDKGFGGKKMKMMMIIDIILMIIITEHGEHEWKGDEAVPHSIYLLFHCTIFVCIG